MLLLHPGCRSTNSIFFLSHGWRCVMMKWERCCQSSAQQRSTKISRSANGRFLGVYCFMYTLDFHGALLSSVLQDCAVCAKKKSILKGCSEWQITRSVTVTLTRVIVASGSATCKVYSSNIVGSWQFSISYEGFASSDNTVSLLSYGSSFISSFLSCFWLDCWVLSLSRSPRRQHTGIPSTLVP